MTSLNLSSNALGELVLPAGWTKEGRRRNPLYKHLDGREQKGHPGEPEGIIAVGNAIKNMRALFKLVMRQNDIHGAKAGRAFADILAQNTVLKELELDLSIQKVGDYGKPMDAAFAKEIAVGISGNGAISTVIVNTFPLPIQNIKSKAALDFSGKELEVEDAIIIAALIPSNVSHTIYIYPSYYR
jgi:hypothetical protein